MQHVTTFIAIVLAPFVAFGLALLARPIASWISKHMKEGWLKRLLFISWKI